jgi:uncharacterized protein (DUF2236 family)
MSTEIKPYLSFAPGPGSVAWRVHASPVTLLGGIRALVIQALLPAAVAGVVDNSNYQHDVWGRLNRTRDFVLTMVYGDVQAAAASAAHVRQIHSRVVGVDHVTGLLYDANDAELLLWVHCVLVESFLVAYQTYGRRLAADQADRYVAEMMRQGVLIVRTASPGTQAVELGRLAFVGGEAQLGDCGCRWGCSGARARWPAGRPG